MKLFYSTKMILFKKVYLLKLRLLMAVFEANYFVQYLNTKLFSIKAEGNRNMDLFLNPSCNNEVLLL